MMIKTIMNDPLIIIESDIPDKTIFFLGVTFRPCRRMTSPDPEWTSLTSEDTFYRGISPRVLKGHQKGLIIRVDHGTSYDDCDEMNWMI